MTTNQNKDIKYIYNAIVDYISDNSIFESNTIIDEAIDKIEKSNSFEEIFRIPIEYRLYNFSHALQWLYFICFNIHIIKDKNIIIPNSFNIAFSPEKAIIYISSTYNSINENLYDDYFYESEEE